MTRSSEFLGERKSPAEFEREMVSSLKAAAWTADVGDLKPQLREALEAMIADIDKEKEV